MKPLRIALTKGRLERNTVALFDRMGLDTSALKEKGRRLILPCSDMEVVLAKSADVITYIRHGVCDIGVVGKDTIMEYGGSYYEMLDLSLGVCKFVLAGRDPDFFGGYATKTVATKYPHVAHRFFEDKGMDVNIIRIDGSVELAPLLGLADAIVDIVETGTTLKENGLSIIEDISRVSARVIVNVAALNMRRKEIDTLIDQLQTAIGEEPS